MKSIRLILTILMFAFLAAPVISFAQDETKSNDTKQTEHQYKLTPDEQATKIAKRLQDKLNLTSGQYTKIQKLFSDRISYFRELREKDLISRSEVKAKRKEFREGIKSTLDKKQQKKLKKMMKKRFKKMHKRHMHENDMF